MSKHKLVPSVCEFCGYARAGKNHPNYKGGFCFDSYMSNLKIVTRAQHIATHRRQLLEARGL